jgi:hypothetical protein
MPGAHHCCNAIPFAELQLPARKRRSHFPIVRSLIFPLSSAGCVFVLYVTIFLVHNPKSIAQRGDFSRDILKEDRRFLDSLFEKMNYDDRRGRQSSLAPIQKIDNASKLESFSKTAPRAMLVVNTEVVRRGQLVVHSEPVKRKRQNITPWRHSAEVL